MKKRCWQAEETTEETEMTVVTEADQSKKRKVAPPKGKGKEKEKATETEVGEEIGMALLEEMRGMRTEMAVVRESVEGLRADFRTLAGIGRTFVKILRNVDHNVGFVADQMDESEVEDGVAGTENGAGEPSTVGDGEAGNNGDGGV